MTATRPPRLAQRAAPPIPPPAPAGGCGAGVGRLSPLLLVAVGLAAALWVAAGVPVRSAFGAPTTGDEPQYLLTALSLAEDGDLDIADELSAGRYRSFHPPELPVQAKVLPGGRRVSPHDPLLPLLLAGPMALGGWVAARLAMAVVAGILASSLVWTAVRRLAVPVPRAILAVGAFALAPPLAVYGSQIYPELPAALAVTAAGAAVSGRLGRGGLALLAAALLALPWLSVKYVPVAASLGVVGLGRLRGRRTAVLAFIGVMAAGGVLYLVLHQELYGGWTAYAAGDHFRAGEWSVMGTHPDLWGRSTRLLGLLVDRTFGLAAWQPGYLLAVPALGALLARRPSGWPALAGPLAAGWLTAAFLAVTMHGWWWPGRQVVAVLPAAVLTVAWWAGRGGRRGRWLWAAVGLGVLSYGFLLIEGLSGRVTWVVGFDRTLNPLYRAWRVVLPDYMHPGGATWVLHGAWLAVLAALGWRARGRGRRRAARSRARRPIDESTRSDG